MKQGFMISDMQNSVENTKPKALSGPFWLRPPKSRFRIYSTPMQYLALSGAIVSGRMKPGPANKKLEQELQTFLGVPNAVAVDQARVGIYLAIKAVVTPERPRVVMSPYTVYDVVNMVIAAGGEPVFADIDRPSCNIDPVEVEKLVDDKTSAVLVTHLHGLAADIEPIGKLCRERGVMLIEDSAQAFGIKSGKQFLGTHGDIGVYSFGLFKTVNSFFGGAVVCKDEAVAEKIRFLQANYSAPKRMRMLKRLIQGLVFDVASFPIVFKAFTFWVFRYGTLSGNEHIQKITKSEQNPVLRDHLPKAYQQNMSEVQAGMVLKQLDQVEVKQKARIETAILYHDALQGRNDVITPRNPPSEGNGCLAYPIQVENRQEIIEMLMREGRDCAPQHLNNCADLEIFKPWYRDCPNARIASKSVILLPTYPRYGEREARRNIAVLTQL
jgi:perosamine synthetase